LPGSRTGPRRLLVPALGAILFLAVFALVVSVTLPGDIVLSAVRPALRARGLDIDAETASLRFPFGVRLKQVVVSAAGNPLLSLDQVDASWEWTGLFRWRPAHLRLARGGAVADLHFSPAFWNPRGGSVSLSGVSSTDLPLPVFSSSNAGFSIDRIEAAWSTSGGKVSASGSGTLRFLRIPVPAPGSPIREARIDNVDISFLVRGDVFQVPRLTGAYEGSSVDGTGEIARFSTPERSSVTFHLRIRNPFEGRVAELFDMMAKNAKNANLRITGTLALPAGEFQFF
jgi:type II secretion system protein N